jgi:PAS domain S-box-containing protein
MHSRFRAFVDRPSRAELVELRAQQRRFTAMLDAVEDQVVLNDQDGALLFANRAAAAAFRELTGQELHELVGKRPDELGLPEELARYGVTETERVKATQAPVTNEIALAERGGARRWYEQKLSPVFIDGRLSAQVMIGRDVGERKRAQRRLELLSKVSALVGNLDLEELLPKIAQLSIPELADWSAVDVRSRDETVRRVYVAHRDPGQAVPAARQFGLCRAPAAWKDLLAGRSLFLADVPDEVLYTDTEQPEHLAPARQLGFRSLIAVPLRLRDATVAVMSFATTVESGRRYGPDDLALAEELARRATDLIDRARLHAELKASEARFRIALATARVAVFEQDRELRYRWHYNSVLGQDAVGKTHEDLFPTNEAAELTAIKRRVMETGEPAREEIRLTLGGKPHMMLSVMEPVRDDRDNIVGIIGAATDISDEKQAQESLAQAVTFREQVMGILGHDLRNPLAAIVAATGLLLRRRDLAPPAVEYVDRIDRSARRMAEMIRTVLDFTQVRFHGSLPVSPVPTDLAEVARAIVEELRAAEPGRAIEIEIDGDTHGQWDPARLGQVVSNLVGNALVHGAAGEPVRVSIDVIGNDVWLSVHNRGSAIASEMKAALFEPFHRGAEPARSGQRRGLGLGLYIVRQIVMAHDGSITVESTPTDGTTFIIRLPRASRAARSAG